MSQCECAEICSPCSSECVREDPHWHQPTDYKPPNKGGCQESSIPTQTPTAASDHLSGPLRHRNTEGGRGELAFIGPLIRQKEKPTTHAGTEKYHPLPPLPPALPLQPLPTAFHERGLHRDQPVALDVEGAARQRQVRCQGHDLRPDEITGNSHRGQFHHT